MKKKTEQQVKNFASKIEGLDWYLDDLDPCGISKFNSYEFLLTT